MTKISDTAITNRSNRDFERLSEELQRTMLRQLEREAETMLGGLRDRFQNDLSQSLTEALRLLQSSAGGVRESGTSPLPSLGGIVRILGSVAGQRRTRTSSVTAESGRSQEAFQQFRLSQSQSLAEASDTLARGSKSF